MLVATASILDTVFAPAGHSVVPVLVDAEDLSANAWLGTALNLQVTVGPLLGGLFGGDAHPLASRRPRGCRHAIPRGGVRRRGQRPLVFLSRDVLGAGPVGYDVIAGAFGVEMLVASIALSGGRSRSPRTVFIGGWILTAAGTLLTGSLPAVWLAAMAQATDGVGNGADNVASDTLIQRSVPREMLGRVFGVTSSAAFVGGGIA